MTNFHGFSALCSCDSVRVVISRHSIVFRATPARGVVHVTASQLQLRKSKTIFLTQTIGKQESALTAESSQWNLTGNDQPTLVLMSFRLLHTYTLCHLFAPLWSSTQSLCV
jgi:hypothetical protein